MTGWLHVRRRLAALMLVPFVLLIVGTIGYKVVEGSKWSWLDCLYMSAITLTTIGYGETHPLSKPGRVFTIVYAMTGVFTLFYVAGEFLRIAVSGEIRTLLGKRRMEHKLAALSQHVIVCGYGRMGRFVCREFEAKRVPYVVIDKDDAVAAEVPPAHGIFVHGDATSDTVLKHAGVLRARALVTVASSDADNLYVVLSARLLNDRLFIVARAEESAAEEKLTRVGANRVISPYVISGSRVALAVLRPTVVDIIDLATRNDSAELQIEEIRLDAGCPLAGKALRQCGIADMGLVVVAIKRPNGVLIASPAGEDLIEAGSTIVVIGNRENLDRLARMAEAASIV